MSWSPQEDKIVYVAEKKPPKTAPFYSQTSAEQSCEKKVSIGIFLSYIKKTFITGNSLSAFFRQKLHLVGGIYNKVPYMYLIQMSKWPRKNVEFAGCPTSYSVATACAQAQSVISPHVQSVILRSLYRYINLFFSVLHDDLFNEVRVFLWWRVFVLSSLKVLLESLMKRILRKHCTYVKKKRRK